MAFELYKKSAYSGTGGLEPNSVSVTKTGVGIGRGFKDLLEGYNFVELYFDRENNQVGLKPTNSKLTGFKIDRKNVSPRVATDKIPKLIRQGNYPAEIIGGMIVFQVKEIAVRNP